MLGLKLALCSALAAVVLSGPSSLRLEPRDSEAAHSARFSAVQAWPANRDAGLKWFRQKMKENLAETLAKRDTAIAAAKEKVWHEALKRPEFATLSMNTKKDITVTASNGAQAVLTVHGVSMDAEADMRKMSAIFVTKLMLEAYPDVFPKKLDIVISDQSGPAIGYVYPASDATDAPLVATVFLPSVVKNYSPARISLTDMRGGLDKADAQHIITVGDLVADAYKASGLSLVVGRNKAIETNVMHEFCHVLHQAQNPRSFWDNADVLATRYQWKAAHRGVSMYAGSKGMKSKVGAMNEFIAEVCAGRMQEMPFPQYVETLYSSLGGPAVKDEMRPYKGKRGVKFFDHPGLRALSEPPNT